MTQFEKNWNLFLAAKDGSVEKARTLIADGADPNFVQPPTGRLHFHQLSSVLCRAVGQGHNELVSFLLKNGAKIPDDVRWQEKLGYAAQCASRPDILIVLLDAGLPISKDHQRWAENEGYRELVDYLNAKAGPRVIRYDIDALLAGEPDEFLIRFGGLVPEDADVASKALFREEIVVRDIADFDLQLGSGFSAMFGNGRFDCFSRAFVALAVIEATLAHKALSELLAGLAPFGYSFDEKKDNAVHERLSDAERGAVELVVTEIDRKYFHGDPTLSLWQNRAHVEQCMAYVRRHLSIFRRRNIG